MSTSGTKENHSNSLSGTGSVNVDSTATRSSILSPLCEDADSGDSRQASSSLQQNPEPQTVVPQIMHHQNASTINSYNTTSVLGTSFAFCFTSFLALPNSCMFAEIVFSS
jgi:hypothetical protein